MKRYGFLSIFIFLGIRVFAQGGAPEIYIRISGVSVGQWHTVECIAEDLVWNFENGSHSITNDPDLLHSVVGKTADAECIFFGFDWDNNYSPGQTTHIGKSRYKILFRNVNGAAVHCVIDNRFCHVSGSPDVFIRFDFGTGQIYQTEVSSCIASNKNITGGGVDIPGEPYGTECYPLPKKIRNTFEFIPEATPNGTYLIVDDCSGRALSHSEYPFYYAQKYSINPDEFKYDNLGNSKKYRFHHWLSDELNSEIFFSSVADNQNDIPSRFFETVNNALLSTQLEGDNASLPIIIFDPWKVEAGPNCQLHKAENITTQIAVPLSGYNMGDYDGFGGVHRNQNYLDPDDPFYSLRGSNILTYSVGNWVHKPSPPLAIGDAFLFEWILNSSLLLEMANDPNQSHQATGYTTNAVKFKADGGIATASYKAHRVSNEPFSTTESQSATSPNSQRKIDFHNGVHHAVYSSMGEVWFIESADNGVTWSAEQRVSSGRSAAKHPCLVMGDNGTYVCFIEQALTSEWEVIIKKYESGVWDELLFGPYIDHTAFSDAAPVIEENSLEGIVVVVWEPAASNALRCAVFQNDMYRAWQTVPNSGIGVRAERPTVAHNQSYSNTTYHLSWREGGVVHYQEVFVRTNGGVNLSFITYPTFVVKITHRISRSFGEAKRFAPLGLVG